MRDWLDPANFEDGVQHRPLALRGHRAGPG
jgi:hypothetical protein